MIGRWRTGLLAPLALAAGISAAGADDASTEKQKAGRTIAIRAVAAYGLFPKVMTVRGVRAGETVETEFARFEYVGRLKPARFSEEWVIVPDVESAYLRMDIEVLYETPYTRPVMRSDDPAVSKYLFYREGERWVQRNEGEVVDVFDDLDCTLTDQSWEDGGGFDHQDFFFQIKASDCSIASR